MQDGKNEDTSALIETVNKTGRAFLITTDLSGRTVARIACGGFLTQACASPSPHLPKNTKISQEQTVKIKGESNGEASRIHCPQDCTDVAGFPWA